MSAGAPALQDVHWGTCALPQHRDRELESAARKALGFVPPYLGYLAPCPWLAHATIRGFLNGQLAHLDLRLAELVFLTVSRDNSCRYCYASQRLLLRVLGLSEEEIGRLEEDAYTAQRDPRQHLALDFARRVSRASPSPTAADRAALGEAGFSTGEIAELAFLASWAAAANRVTTLPAFPLEAVEQNERWYMRPVWPLIRRAARQRRRAGAARPLASEEREGIFAHAVLALDGLPAAPGLRWDLDQAWSSPILPQRAKALVFAVVARGLGCDASEAEARRLLAERGLDAGQVDPILAHLAAAELDALEATVVPFARETIWYRPEEIQRRARDLVEELGPARFLELVGVAALANNVCRLSKALDGA